MSILDKNNPEFNKPLEPFPKDFQPTCDTLEECTKKALPASSFKLIKEDMHKIDAKFLEPNVQRLVELHDLTELETKCIIIYTLISKQRDEEGELPYHQNLFFLFCKAYRERDDGALLKFADYSFHFWNGLAKLPKETPVLFRGLSKRLEEMNDLYVEGNTVHWHYPSSSSTDSNVSQGFANGGTLLKFDGITDARSIEEFSLVPTEKEFLLPYTSLFKVIVALSCNQARLLESFVESENKTPPANEKIETPPANSKSTLPVLPPNVDLVVLKCCSAPLTTSTNRRAAPASQRHMQRHMSFATHHKMHLQGALMVDPLSDASLHAAASKKPLPAFLKQVSLGTPRAVRRQASNSAVSIQRSPSTKRFDDAQRAGQRGSLQSPKVHADDVRVEVAGVQAVEQGQAAHAAIGNELNGVALIPSASGEGRGHVPVSSAHAAGANGGFSRPFLRQQALRPRPTATAPEVMYNSDCMTSEIEPSWNEDVAL
jgi:hypothetical protein